VLPGRKDKLINLSCWARWRCPVTALTKATVRRGSVTASFMTIHLQMPCILRRLASMHVDALPVAVLQARCPSPKPSRR